jgi:hypothetical protein
MTDIEVMGIVISFFNILFTTPLFWSVIWHERFGSDVKRTLLNQLVSSRFVNNFEFPQVL